MLGCLVQWEATKQSTRPHPVMPPTTPQPFDTSATLDPCLQLGVKLERRRLAARKQGAPDGGGGAKNT